MKHTNYEVSGRMNVSEPPRVGYVVKRYPRYSETFIVNEILAHEDAGWEIDIFSLRPPCDTHFQDLLARVRAPVTYLDGSTSRLAGFWQQFGEAHRRCGDMSSFIEAACDDDVADVQSALMLAQHVQRRQIQHLHAHFATSAASVARLASLLTRVPYTLTAHAKDIFHCDVDRDQLCRKLSDAAGAVTVSDYNVAHLREECGAAAARVERIYNGMRLEDLTYTAPTERLPRIASVGRLVEKKGFGILISACELLKRRGVAFECDIIGGGELESELRDQIVNQGLEGVVHMLGPRPHSEVLNRLRQAAAFAAPCIVGEDGNRDGLPTVLLEAMALGTPCVSTDVTGIPEILQNRCTGLLIPQHATVELADALQELLATPALRTNLASHARRLIESEFDIRRNTAQLRDLFTRAASSRRCSTRLRALDRVT